MRALGLLAACALACGNDDHHPASPLDGSTDDVGSSGRDALTDVTVAEAGDLITVDCVAKINAYRAATGSPPISSKNDEIACADDQAAKGESDRADSGVTKFYQYRGQCSEAHQIECWYSVDDPDAVIDWCLYEDWVVGPPETGTSNYSLLADPATTTVACGFSRLSGGGYWMTLDFY